MKEKQTSNPKSPADEEDITNNSEEKFDLSGWWQRNWQRLLRLGLGENALRVITGAIAVVMILVVVWVMSSYFLNETASEAEPSLVAVAQQTVVGNANTGSGVAELTDGYGISRLAQCCRRFRPR